MKLSVWTYEGPPHVGAMRVATGMTGLHYVLHAPQGDTYADLLFTMIERRDHRPPVTYTTFQARDLGADTANLFKTALQAAHDRFQPQAIIVGASCTAELIQDDPGGMAETMGIPVPIVPLELPSYQRKENFGADETFFQLVRALARPCDRTDQPSVNLLGPTALGFRHRDDVAEITRMLAEMGVAVNVAAPMGATPKDLERLPAAHANVMLYPETCESACRFLEREHGMPYTRTVPIGVGAAIYLEEFAPKNRLTDFIEVNINNLAAVPSIVFGLLGLAVFINLFGLPRSAPLVGGMVLALMTLPTVIISARASLKAVPPSIREAALGVSASRTQAVFHHVLPLAMPGILTGSIIGLAQALGETAPLLMIGMVAFIADPPTLGLAGFTEPATVMPVQIYIWSSSAERAFEARTAAAILALLTLLISFNAVAIYLRCRFERRW